MTEKIAIQGDDKITAHVWRLHGLAVALGALGGDKPLSTLPGFVMAHALVQKEIAEERTQMSGAVYRAAAKAGHDVSNLKNIYTNVKNGRPVIEMEPADLVDLAD